MTDDVPPVSVIMPARNAADTIGASLLSVLDQPALGEVIVVNDGSTDATAMIAGGIGDLRVRVIAGPCRGISAALNVGFAAAAFPFVARCDADDLFEPDRLGRQAAWLAAHPDFIGISGGFVTIDDAGRELAELAADCPAQEVTKILREGAVPTHLCTWLIRRASLMEIGGAREWFETAEDIDLQLRLAAAGRVWHDPRSAYRYRLHGRSITHGTRRARLDFFDHAATAFMKERQETGSDPLDRGQAPYIPIFAGESDLSGDLRAQMIGHLTSQAWRDFQSGRRSKGLLRLCDVIRRQPFRVQSWRGLAVMLVRYMC